MPHSVERVLALVALVGPLARSHAGALLWPDAPPTRASANLRAAISRLGVVAEGFLHMSGEILALAEDVSLDLGAAHAWIDATIYEAAQTRPECAGMGTTFVAAVFHGTRVSIAHIGDSRCYRLRGGRFEQLTRDHSLLQEQIDSGHITPDQARFSLNKNLVTRALGIEAIVPADISEFRVEPDDIYLLCSDGLTDMVDTEVVHGVVDEQRDTLDAAATQLIDLANQNGGRDNISVILARVPAAFLPNNQWAEKYLARRRASP